MALATDSFRECDMSRKVLIVEDADICSATLEIALVKVPGLRIEFAATAEQALKLLSIGDVSALITDIHLPRMDGFELIEQVRAQPELAHLPILVISGDSDPKTPTRLKSLGVDAYFPKPYSPAEVRQTLEHLIYAY
jgi:two-component system, chemotaxis family, chemotaxis protein CheY